jgi:hypothetical protein
MRSINAVRKVLYWGILVSEEVRGEMGCEEGSLGLGLTSSIRSPSDGVGLTGWDELAEFRMPDWVAAGWLGDIGGSVSGCQSREGGETGCECELHLGIVVVLVGVRSGRLS